jgi:hypothetical protein
MVIKIKSTQCDEGHEISYESAIKSTLLADMLEGYDEKDANPSIIPFEIQDEIIIKIIEFLDKLTEEHTIIKKPFAVSFNSLVSDWECAFYEIPSDELIVMSLAADFLGIDRLAANCNAKLSDMIRDQPPEVIREILGLPDDLTDEEKAEIARQNSYLMDTPIDEESLF